MFEQSILTSGPSSATGRPIFLVGMSRSGCTVFYRRFAKHPEVAAITKATRKFPTNAVLSRLLVKLSRDHCPTEAGSMWDRFCKQGDDVLEAADASPLARDYFLRVVQTHLAVFGRSRFLSKCPRNGLRIGFLDAIFPDAVFVHLLRDGRAVCQSVLRMREKHGGLREWWDVRPPGWQRLESLEPVDAVAHQWRDTVEAVRAAGRALPEGRYLEVRYEDLTEDPVGVFQSTGAACGLTWPAGLAERLTADVRSQNHKWREAFSAEEIAVLNEVMGPAMNSFGYEL